MTFANVLLFCIGGIAVCAALVFAVETLVAFCLHEEEEPVTQHQVTTLTLSSQRQHVPTDRAA
ncbi:MAG TPA: hypothetical protein VKV02_13690 [Acidobacteriaceae bacterium]|nr:hypothetical protein [Acidobacteriaceae bacterium]